MNALIHKLRNLQAKSQAYKYMGQPVLSASFDNVARMIERGHLKTLTKVNAELKRRNLNDK